MSLKLFLPWKYSTKSSIFNQDSNKNYVYCAVIFFCKKSWYRCHLLRLNQFAIHLLFFSWCTNCLNFLSQKVLYHNVKKHATQISSACLKRLFFSNDTIKKILYKTRIQYVLHFLSFPILFVYWNFIIHLFLSIF